MRKPVSKHALRRALEQVHAEGRIGWEEPTGSVVDRLWHHITREATGARKKPGSRDALRERAAAGV